MEKEIGTCEGEKSTTQSTASNAAASFSAACQPRGKSKNRSRSKQRMRTPNKKAKVHKFTNEQGGVNQLSANFSKMQLDCDQVHKIRWDKYARANLPDIDLTDTVQEGVLLEAGKRQFAPMFSQKAY